jgi:hypothetical protein
MRQLLEHLQAIALRHGASLTHSQTLHPMSIESNAKSGDFSRGVLATVVEVYWLAGQAAEGRQAILDLGFQPLFERVEGE